MNGADHRVCPWQKVHKTPHCVLTTPVGRSFYLNFGRAYAFRSNLEARERDLREVRDTGREEDESMR